jgi:CopG family nickel-responsive transcriptional regulator
MPIDQTRFTISLDEPLLESFDDYVHDRGYPTRSEAVRDLIRDKLFSDEDDDSGEKIGVLNVLFELKSKAPARVALRSRRVADMLKCSTQTPVGDDHSLAVFVLEGSAGRMKRFADAVLSIKGVLHGDLKFTGGVETLAALSTPRAEPRRRPAKAAT